MKVLSLPKFLNFPLYISVAYRNKKLIFVMKVQAPLKFLIFPLKQMSCSRSHSEHLIHVYVYVTYINMQINVKIT